MNLELKTELFMTMEDYISKRVKKFDNGMDITALDKESDDKILLRVITEPMSKSGIIGVDIAGKMTSRIKNEDYDKVILISENFTRAAKEKLRGAGIKSISGDFLLDFPPERLYLAARKMVDDLCEAKCGKIPKKESDCKGNLNNHYSCEVRLISDNLSYHFTKGWTKLLQKDILRLQSIDRSNSN